MDYDRYNRWIRASYAVASIEPFMFITIQGLGQLDSQLFYQDRVMHFKRESGLILETEEEGIAFTERLTLSYLWVLGAYEVVRSIDQHFRETDDSSWHQRSFQLKCRFERLRVPLAKFESAKRHQSTDSHVAFPVINERFGVAWQVAPSEFIARGELSDLLLSFIEEFRREADA